MVRINRIENILVKILLWVTLALGLCFISIVTFKFVIEFEATKRANQILAPLKKMVTDKEDYVITIAKWASNNWSHEYADKSINRGSIEIPYFLKIFLEHRFLPDFMRLRVGALNVYNGKYDSGKCNTWADTFSFLLSLSNIKTQRIDMFTNNSGHSAFEVFYNEKWHFLDPYLGVAFEKDGDILSLDQVKYLVQNNENITNIMLNLKPNIETSFYNNIETLSFGTPENEIWLNIYLPDNLNLILGKIDGKWNDVQREGIKNKMTSHMGYLGPKYGRNFKFRFVSKTPLTIAFDIISDLHYQHIPKSNHNAKIEKNTIIYKTTIENPSLELDYSYMQWNIDRFIRQKNYYDVDRLQFIYQ